MWIPIPATRTETTVARSTATTFQCPSCRYRARALVHGKATVVQTNVLGLRGRFDDEKAVDTARDEIRHTAFRSVRLLPCPACGAVDFVGQLRAYLRGFIAPGLFSIAVSVFVSRLLARTGSPFGIGAALATGVAIALAACWLDYRAKLRRAQRDIVLEVGGVVTDTPQIAGRTCVACQTKIIFATDGIPVPEGAGAIHVRCVPTHAGLGGPFRAT